MGIHNKLFCLLFVYSKTLFVKHYIHLVVGAGTLLCMSVCKTVSSILVKFFLFDSYYVWEFLKRMNGLELMKCWIRFLLLYILKPLQRLCLCFLWESELHLSTSTGYLNNNITIWRTIGVYYFLKLLIPNEL